MKKQMAGWILFSMVVLLIGSASLLPNGAKFASLATGRFIANKGIVFIFDLSGSWKWRDLRGAVAVVSGVEHPLYCRFNDYGQASCVAKGLAAYEGRDVTLLFGGYKFYTTVPTRVCHYSQVLYRWQGDNKLYSFVVRVSALDDILKTKPDTVTILRVACVNESMYQAPK